MYVRRGLWEERDREARRGEGSSTKFGGSAAGQLQYSTPYYVVASFTTII
jgi:hypothetical protein